MEMSTADVEKLDTEFQMAKKAFEEACASPSITEGDYNAIRDRYMTAMKARHQSLGYGL